MPENRWELLHTCLQQAAEESPYKDDIKSLSSLKEHC